MVHLTSRALRPDEWYGPRVSEGTGIGFVWDERGYVVTNWHVVQAMKSEIIVRLQGLREYHADVVGGEEKLDIAVVKIRNPPSGLRPLPLGTSKLLRVGQSVFAIGNPFGLDHSLSTGVVSALDRTIESVAGTPIQGVIQVDAAINPGNSGGPLLDSAGRLIGMNTAIVSASRTSAGVGFAVPVDTINRTVPRLMRGEAGTRPGLGVAMRPVQMPDGAMHPLIVRVEANTGAAEAGLRGSSDKSYGDVIVAIDGATVRTNEDVTAILDQKELGQKVRMRILRHAGGDSLEFQPLEVEVSLKFEYQRERDR